MVLVILQHSYLNVNVRLIPHFLGIFILGFSNLAAVAFVSISGTIFSYFLYIQPNWRATFRRYAWRAVFLILVAHHAINLTSYFFRMAGNSNSRGSGCFLERFILHFPITDTIAICLLVSPVFILGFGPAVRAMTIVTLLVTTPLIAAFVNPTVHYLLVFKEALFGLLEPSRIGFPLVPWLGVFLTGSFVGQSLANVKQGKSKHSTFVREMNKTAIALAGCSVILTVSYKLLKMAFAASWNYNLFLAIYPGQTTTLLAGYLAVLGWLSALLTQRIDISGHYDRFVWLLSILGRTSLFTFVVQFAVVESAPALLGFTGSLGFRGFLVLFVLGLTFTWTLSYSYGRMRGWFQKDDYAECVNAASAHRSAS